jgi:hypothetical protein
MNCFAGVDWASRDHAVCVIDNSGATRDCFAVTHDAAGLRELTTRLRRFAPAPAQLSIAIERPSGLVVDALVDYDPTRHGAALKLTGAGG